MYDLHRLPATLLGFAATISTTWALPTPDKALNERQNSLVVWPVGASIVWGQGSSTGNGFRQNLLDLLSSSSIPITYTGSITSGSMANNQNEGHSGYIIDDVSSVAASYLQTITCPSIALLHVGTNDAHIPVNPSTAHERIGNLLDNFATICPDMPVIVAQLIRSNDATTQSNIDLFNPLIPSVVAQRVQDYGRKYITIDMSGDFLSTSDLSDDLHPNDNGYYKMAQGFYNGFVTARNNGWI